MSYFLFTNTPLLKNQEFICDPVSINKDYVSVAVSINSNVTGELFLYYSLDGLSYSDYGDFYSIPAGSWHRETSVKGKYFKLRFFPNDDQSVFTLGAKFNLIMSEDINVNTSYTHDSMTVYANSAGFNIRHLSSNDDSVYLPQLTPVLITDAGVTTLNVTVKSMPPISVVVPPISGVQITDSNGNDILSNTSGYLQTQIMNSSLTVGGSVSISNQISGYAQNSTLLNTNTKLDSLITGTRILSSNGSNITTDSNSNLNVIVNNQASIPVKFLNTEINQLEISNFPQVQEVSGSINAVITNDLIGITGSVFLNNSEPLAVTGAFFQEVQPVSGSLTVNTISNFATETTLSELNNKINNDLVLTDSIQTVVKNTVSIGGAVTVTSGSIAVDTLPYITANNNSMAIYGAELAGTQHIIRTDTDGSIIITPQENAVFTVDTGITSLYISNSSLNVETGLTSIFINNSSLNVETGLTSIFINNSSLNVDTGLTSLYISNFPSSQNVNLYASNGVNNPSELKCGSFGNLYMTPMSADGYQYDLTVTTEGARILNTNITNASEIGVTNVYISNTSPIGVTGSVSILNQSLPVTIDQGVTVNNFPNSYLVKGDDYSGTSTYNNLYVDANGFISANIVEAVHENILIGFDNNHTKMTINTGLGVEWSSINPYSNDQDGWYASGNYANASLLWYNNGDYLTSNFNTQSEFTFGDIDIWYMILANYNCTTSGNMPMIRIYSKPTSTNDFLPDIAHSRWDFTIDANQFLSNGMSYMIYNGLLSRVKLNDIECPRIHYSLTGGGGTRANTEVINHIELYYASSGTIINLLVVEGAVYVKQKGLLNYYFTNDNKAKSEETTITQLGKMIFDNDTGLKVHQMNNPSSILIQASTGTTNKNILCDLSGRLETNSNISGSISNSSFGANVRDGNGNLITSSSGTGSKLALDVSLINDGVKFLVSDGSNLLPAKSNTDGKLYSLLNDGAGNSITSTTNGTSRGIDMNILNKPNILDSNGQSIVALTNTGAVQGALKFQQVGSDTNSYISDINANYAGTSYTAQANFITNGYQTPVVMGGWSGLGSTINVAKVSNNSLQCGLDTTQNGVKITDSSNNIVTTSSPNTSFQNQIKGLDTMSYLLAHDMVLDAYDNLTEVNSDYPPSSNYRALDTYIRNTALNNTTTNYINSVGLNTYVIAPKSKTFYMNGFSGTGATAGSVVGFFATSASFSFNTFGGGKQNVRAYYLRATGALPGTVSWTGVNANGDEVSGTTAVPAINTAYQIGGAGATFVSINSFKASNNRYPNSATGDQLFIETTTNQTTSSIGGCNSAYTANGMYTCPNGCIAYVQSFSAYCSASESLYLRKSFSDGSAMTVFRFDNITSISGYAGNPDGYIVLNPGESLFFVRNSSASLNVFTYASIKQVYV